MRVPDVAVVRLPNAGGETAPSDGTPGCWKADGVEFQGRLQGDFPHIEAADYSKPED